MIDVNDLQYLTTEDFVKMMTELFDAQRALLNDQELLMKKFANDRYLTALEVAEMLKISATQIPRDIPCAHIGRSYIYSKADIDKWIMTHKRTRS